MVVPVASSPPPGSPQYNREGEPPSSQQPLPLSTRALSPLAWPAEGSFSGLIQTYEYLCGAGSVCNRKIYFQRPNGDPGAIRAKVMALYNGSWREISDLGGSQIDVNMMTAVERIDQLEEAQRSSNPFPPIRSRKLSDLLEGEQNSILADLAPGGSWGIQSTKDVADDPRFEKIIRLILFRKEPRADRDLRAVVGIPPVASYRYTYRDRNGSDRQINFYRDNDDPRAIRAQVEAFTDGQWKEISRLSGEEIKVRQTSISEMLGILKQAQERSGEVELIPDKDLSELTKERQDEIFKKLEPMGTWRVEIIHDIQGIERKVVRLTFSQMA